MANSTLNVTYRTRKTGTGTQDTQKELEGLNKTVFGLKNAMGVLAGGTALGAVTAGLKFAINEAMEAERVMALTESTIKATGGAAGLTAEQVSNMAGRLSEMTGIADDVIQSGQNMLLTFKEIKGDNFERATMAMNDMAVAMNGGSLEGLNLKDTAVQLGKALNDPLQGLTALSRVGVSFTEEQKSAIKAMMEMNDVAGAQAIILAELESEFGGAAEAAGETLAGNMAKLKNAVSELAEELGTELIPVLSEAAEAAVLLIQWNDKIAQAYDEHVDQVALTADTYDDYQREVLRSAVAAGKLDQAWVNLHGDGVRLGGTHEYLMGKVQLLTPAQFEAARAVNEFGVAAHVAGWEARQLAEAQYNAEQATQAQTDRLQGLADALGAAGDANFVVRDSVYDATAAMRDYTTALFYNEAMASLDKDAQLVLAAHLGLVDNATLTLMGRLPELTALYDENGDGAVNGTEDVQGYLQALIALESQISAMDGKTANVAVNVNYNTPTPPEVLSNIPANPGNNAQTDFATGTPPGGFIVPPGFWHDNYRINVSSGERVIVQTPEQQATGAGGGLTIQNLNIYAGNANADQLARILTNADIRRRTGARG